MKRSDLDLYDMTFNHDGTAISNPTLSTCGRFLADPIKDYGFQIIQTGGGCTALQKRVNGGWVVLARECSHELGEVLTPFVMGFYDDSEDGSLWGNELGMADLQVGVNVTTEDEIDSLAEDALNAMCKTVQDWLGITNGDNAAAYFSDDRFKGLIKDYIRDEISYKRASYQKAWEGV